MLDKSLQFLLYLPQNRAFQSAEKVMEMPFQLLRWLHESKNPDTIVLLGCCLCQLS